MNVRRMLRFYILLLVTQMFLFNFCNSSNHFGTFFYGANEEIIVNDHDLAIDESFHECGLNKICKYNVQQTKNGKYVTVNEGESFPQNKRDLTIWEKVSKTYVLEIEILSAGFRDTGGRKSTIKVNGIDYSKNKRGFNFVILSGATGEVVSIEIFDTYYRQSEANRMITYINSVKNGSVVLISIRDEASWQMTQEAEQIIHSLGATTRLRVTANIREYDKRYQGSFVLVTKKGGRKPLWFAEKAADGGKGPSRVEINLCSASNYFGTLFYGIKGEMTEASNEHGAMIDEKFHECGMNKVCKYVVQNTNNGHYSTENEGKSLQKSKGDGTIWEKELKGTNMVHVNITSAGYNDLGGRRSYIIVNGTDYSKKTRGFNIVVVSDRTGKAISSGVFNPFLGPGESNRIIQYIASIHNGKIVLISVYDDASVGLTEAAEKAVHSLGATTRLRLVYKKTLDERFRGSFILLTRKGGFSPSWFVEKVANRGKGPVQVVTRVPLDG